MWVLLAACRELAVDYNTLSGVVFAMIHRPPRGVYHEWVECTAMAQAWPADSAAWPAQP